MNRAETTTPLSHMCRACNDPDEDHSEDPIEGVKYRRHKSAERVAQPHSRLGHIMARKPGRAVSLEPDWVMNPNWNPIPTRPRTDEYGASTSASTLSYLDDSLSSSPSRGRKRRRSIEDEAEVARILTSAPYQQYDDFEIVLRESMSSSKKRRMTQAEYEDYVTELAEEEYLGMTVWETRHGWKDDSPSGSDSTLIQPRPKDGSNEEHRHQLKCGDAIAAFGRTHVQFEAATSDLENPISIHDDDSDVDSDSCASDKADRASFARSISPPPRSCQPTRRPKPSQPNIVSAIPVQAWYIMMTDPNGRAYPWVVSQETWNQVAVVIQDGRQELWDGRVVPWVQPVGPSVSVKEELFD